jgi:hypothetical protein
MGYQPLAVQNAPPPPYCSVAMARWDRDRKTAVKELAEALGVHWTRVFAPVWDCRDEPDWSAMSDWERRMEQFDRNPIAATMFYDVKTSAAAQNLSARPAQHICLETKPNAVPAPTEPWSENDGWIYSSMLTEPT